MLCSTTRYATEPVRSEKTRRAALPTDPDQAIEFTERTGVDFLAVSLGSIHINTALKITAAKALQAAFVEKPERDLLEAMDIATTAVEDKATGYIRLFGTSGRLAACSVANFQRNQ